jgi:hypothetical protein
MSINVDNLFPHLSQFVRPKTKRSLQDYSERGELKGEGYFNLKSSCWFVRTGQTESRGSPHQTLKTLDEFIRRLPHEVLCDKIRCKNLMRKICRRKESEFLDTVVEASWALHYWENGYHVFFEQPLDPNNPRGKNADLVVTLGGVRHWLDACSIRLDDADFPKPTHENPSVHQRTPNEVYAKLAAKAKKKYKIKFRQAARSGHFKNDTVGILLCVFKSESIVTRAFGFGHSPAPPPPGKLFQDEPELKLVRVHTLNASQGSDILLPCIYADWKKPETASATGASTA